MLPSPPARAGQLGFLYLPPYRVQGISVAGEQTVIQIPELDVAFDIGTCTRAVLSVPTIALSHAHMDHLGGLPYWFSQRYFQKIGIDRVRAVTIGGLDSVAGFVVQISLILVIALSGSTDLRRDDADVDDADDAES